jgi:hypothetical protein
MKDLPSRMTSLFVILVVELTHPRFVHIVEGILLQERKKLAIKVKPSTISVLFVTNAKSQLEASSLFVETRKGCAITALNQNLQRYVKVEIV